MARLRNWYICGGTGNEAIDESFGIIALGGNIYDDPRFAPGDPIVTSRIDRVEGDEIVTVGGTHYTLDGPPAAGFLVYYRERPMKDPTNPLTALCDRTIAACSEAA